MTRRALVTHLTLVTTTAALPACHKNKAEDTSSSLSPGPLTGHVTIDGSSTVYPLSKAVSEAFRLQNPGVTFTIDGAGTAVGFKKFCAGEAEIADASRPINAAESAQCQDRHITFMELPVAFDSLAVVVSAKNDFVKCLTVQELKTIWEPGAERKVTAWNQVRPNFPSRPLTLFGPGKESGTFDYFALAVVGKESSSRSDYTASEDDSIIERHVAEDPDALGYFGYAYYIANRNALTLVSIDGGRGCVMPSPQTVADGTYQPLSRPLFLYVNTDAAARPEIKAFIHYILGPDNTRHVTTVGYAPLSATALRAQEARFDKGVKGSVLGGHGSVTGVKISAFDDDDDDRVRALLVQ